MRSQRRKRDTDRPDDRLPIRWALIVLAAAAAGISAGAVEGIVAGWCTALATAAILHKVVGTG